MSFTYIAYFLAWKILGWLPEKSAYELMDWLADHITKRNPKGVQRLRSNYLRVNPSVDEKTLQNLVAEGMRSYMRYWCDTFRFPKWSREQIISRVTLVDEYLLKDALALGKGVVVSLPHAGNWDHAGAYYCEMGYPIVSVAEHLEPERLFRKFLSYREAIGMEVFDANSRAMGVLAQRLRQGRLLALVADRDLTKNGVDVTFFDGPARMPAGPALLSVQTGAPFMTAFVRYTDTGIEISFGPTIKIPESGTTSEKVAAMIQESATRLESNLRKHLTDWHMLQRIWIDGDFVERA